MGNHFTPKNEIVETLIQCDKLTVAFGNVVRALDDVTLAIPRGSVTGLVGESGSGKTTLCRVLIALQRATAGGVTFAGEDLAELLRKDTLRYRRRVQMLLQDAAASLSPRMAVGKLLAEPLRIHKLPMAEHWPRVLKAFERLGLPKELLEKYPHQLSGGQARRVAIARALALQPELIIADEPTAGLDLSIRGELLNLMMELKKEYGLTYVIVSHDLNVIRRVTDRTAVMYLGQIIEEGVTSDLFQRPRHPYTAALLSARAVIDPALRQRRIVLKGEIPSPINPPSGCRFHTRCPYVQPMCRTDMPPLLTDGQGSYRCHFPLPGQSAETMKIASVPPTFCRSEKMLDPP
ncbi:ABC transporter ATP-binding protein [Ensifer adhaerens]|uniref:oligopeptide/dipeptide ABC transporter ATP-binding protein n=1 Tax=Ensifer adhaerens TaxID=106592 RepID=UPI001CBD6A5E|nr:ABC transporter ATP-binding protein [Ensifer adhaerens]MBZ7924968.1 ABC transporter ATP-binding protein [Ensifer adhaerens]UAX95824.1 ABC transporter ATP-binding protein [Ensifer adhaerens]UAY04835.1 ABC transporter ATP-binding protein [Ensifer adhaerens]UAY10267.1 ABC transporter ATP-binding protein [Ensifer adhaerens]